MTFEMLVAMLLGAQLPAPPAIAGRVFKAPPVTDDDPHAQAWDAREVRDRGGLQSREPRVPGTALDRIHGFDMKKPDSR